MARKYAQHWIDGKWTDADSTQTESINPATGEEFASFADATGPEVCQSAIDAAVRAFDAGVWSSDAMLRSTALSHAADAYEARMGELIATVTEENGKLTGEAGYETHFIPRALRFAAGLAIQPNGKVSDATPGHQTMVIRQPAGAVGVIVPFNSPSYLSIRAIAPALAAGCTVVAKFPAAAAQSARVLGEIFASIDEIPAGVLNIFVESGSAGAELIVSSPELPVVSYTGSTATGRIIAANAAQHLKRVSLELGGKTPHLVFDDADLDKVVPTIVASSTVFAGQFCMTGSRILVQRGIADRLRSALKDALEKVKAGPATDADSEIGPLINKASVERVDGIVEKAISEGAEVIVRGGPIIEGPLAAGAFYRPALLEVTDSALDIVQQETFGPVQTIMVFDTEEEAIALANETEYGLSACIWSENVNTPIRVSRALKAGLISINDWAALAVEFEEGGFKSSGVGRLGGHAALDEFLESKQIAQTYA